MSLKAFSQDVPTTSMLGEGLGYQAEKHISGLKKGRKGGYQWIFQVPVKGGR